MTMLHHRIGILEQFTRGSPIRNMAPMLPSSEVMFQWDRELGGPHYSWGLDQQDRWPRIRNYPPFQTDVPVSAQLTEFDVWRNALIAALSGNPSAYTGETLWLNARAPDLGQMTPGQQVHYFDTVNPDRSGGGLLVFFYRDNEGNLHLVFGGAYTPPGAPITHYWDLVGPRPSGWGEPGWVDIDDPRPRAPTIIQTAAEYAADPSPLYVSIGLTTFTNDTWFRSIITNKGLNRYYETYPSSLRNSAASVEVLSPGDPLADPPIPPTPLLNVQGRTMGLVSLGTTRGFPATRITDLGGDILQLVYAVRPFTQSELTEIGAGRFVLPAGYTSGHRPGQSMEAGSFEPGSFA